MQISIIFCFMCAHDNIGDRGVKLMETTRTHKRRKPFFMHLYNEVQF